MKRGEVWTVSGPGYAGKPRPAVIVQDDRFDATASVTICVFTTDQTEAPLIRIPIDYRLYVKYPLGYETARCFATDCSPM